MSSPAVSVIIPTYRHAETVEDALASVFAQTFTDYEVIVINDGSPDDTGVRLQPLADAGRIRLITQENQGQAAARNRGIAEAKGEFLALLDDDDLWPSDKLFWQVEALHNAPDAVLVFGIAESFGAEEEWRSPPSPLPSGNLQQHFLEENSILSPGQAIFRAEAFHRAGGFDPTVWGADDWDLYIRMSACGTFLYEHRTALRYRVHAGNASWNLHRMQTNIRRVYRKHYRLDQHRSPIRWFFGPPQQQRDFRVKYINSALNALRQKNYPDAVRSLLSATTTGPAHLFDAREWGRLLEKLRKRRSPAPETLPSRHER